MILYFIFCFLIGSIPTGYLISKLKGVDIKKVGSKNSGATNVVRSVGWKQGVIVLIIDIAKGFLAVYSIQYFSIGETLGFSIIVLSAIGGIISVLGHIFSPFLKFHGGKGVATSVGIYLWISPLTCLGGIFVFACVMYFFKKVSIGTLVGILTLPIFFYLFDRENIYFSNLVCIIFINILIILFSHRENIKRIIDGTELGIKK